MTGIVVAPWLHGSRWPTVAIRRVALLGTGHTPSRSKPEYWENCDVPWVTLADVWQLRDGTVDVIIETKEKISKVGLLNSSAVKHPKGTVMLSRTASVGFSAIMGNDMATSQDFATWTCGPLLHPRFLLHALRAMSPDLKRIAAGSTHKTIYMPDIEKLKIPLPPIDEQRRIVEFLDEVTAKFDRLATIRNRQMSAMAERYAAALSECVVPGISSLKQRGSKWPWLPDSLKFAKLGYFAKVQTGLTVHEARPASENDVEIPYLRVANVQGESLDLSRIKSIRVPAMLARRTILQYGDVVMTEANGNPDNLGRGAVWRNEIAGMSHQNHIFAIRPNKGVLNSDFLSALLASIHGRRYFRFTSNQVGIATTSSSKVLAMPIPLVDFRQQSSIAEECARLRTYSNRAMDALGRQLSVLAERRQALITAAVTGQLDVTTARGADV